MRALAIVLAVVFASACAADTPAGPVVSGFSPATGAPGATVVIVGSGLGAAREVSFGGVPAVMDAVAATRIVTRVPRDATTGPISVRTTSGTAATEGSFVVLAVAADPAAVDATPPPALPTDAGYSHVSVPTSRGTFGVDLIKADLALVSLRTLTANSVACRADCPAKPLADYARETGAYAAMNGTYLCPPDYAECATKVNSYDYAVYNSALGTWLNRPALVGQNAVAIFAGSTATFYRRSYVYAQGAVSRAPITAGISNYPLLVEDGRIVDSEREQSATQKQRNTKGAIGVDGRSVYLALIASASVTDAAYVMQALGARDALNLDGGGTSAMWIEGSYRVGPGRLLPNAIVLVKQ